MTTINIQLQTPLTDREQAFLDHAIKIKDGHRYVRLMGKRYAVTSVSQSMAPRYINLHKELNDSYLVRDISHERFCNELEELTDRTNEHGYIYDIELSSCF
jgi:hypothetical protein